MYQASFYCNICVSRSSGIFVVGVFTSIVLTIATKVFGDTVSETVRDCNAMFVVSLDGRNIVIVAIVFSIITIAIVDPVVALYC